MPRDMSYNSGRVEVSGMNEVLHQTYETSDKIKKGASELDDMSADLSKSPFVAYMNNLKGSIIN